MQDTGYLTAMMGPDYLMLVEWTGRVIREDKRGAIPTHLPGILQRLNIDPENWFTLTTEFERKTQSFVGERIKSAKPPAYLAIESHQVYPPRKTLFA
ncbi:hypothetical protein [Microbulbifer sp.]|uniref:hypothetical protein n=1 Tax=Microbulbifer sp. TaxID=1908541 RepID=UPI003F32A9BB